MSDEIAHIGAVMESKNRQILGLHVTPAEAIEFERRLELGDRIPEIERILGIQYQAPSDVIDFGAGVTVQLNPIDPSLLDDVTLEQGYVREDVEGRVLTDNPNFGGAWQDQMDGGRLVVALVDPTKENIPALERAAGGPENLKIVTASLSESELEIRRDEVMHVLAASGIPADVTIESLSDGKHLTVTTSEVESARSTLAPRLLAEIDFVEGPVSSLTSYPQQQHSESDQQPGLRIESSQGIYCTWGVNGHTSSLNYITTAGHCFPLNPVYSGWAYNTELYQPYSSGFLLTPGTQYLKTADYYHALSTYPYTVTGRDVARMSSPQADSNCYHTSYDCFRFIRYRALHNSWEVNSDWVCMSMGQTNDYDCGVVLQENHHSTNCGINHMVRYDIDTSGGDSGGGVIGHYSGSGASIDAIHACGGGATWGAGNTAYHAKVELGFDYNCASSVVAGRPANQWGSCPTINR